MNSAYSQDAFVFSRDSAGPYMDALLEQVDYDQLLLAVENSLFSELHGYGAVQLPSIGVLKLLATLAVVPEIPRGKTASLSVNERAYIVLSETFRVLETQSSGGSTELFSEAVLEVFRDIFTFTPRSGRSFGRGKAQREVSIDFFASGSSQRSSAQDKPEKSGRKPGRPRGKSALLPSPSFSEDEEPKLNSPAFIETHSLYSRLKGRSWDLIGWCFLCGQRADQSAVYAARWEVLSRFVGLYIRVMEYEVNQWISGSQAGRAMEETLVMRLLAERKAYSNWVQEILPYIFTEEPKEDERGVLGPLFPDEVAAAEAEMPSHSGERVYGLKPMKLRKALLEVIFLGVQYSSLTKQYHVSKLMQGVVTRLLNADCEELEEFLKCRQGSSFHQLVLEVMYERLTGELVSPMGPGDVLEVLEGHPNALDVTSLDRMFQLVIVVKYLVTGESDMRDGRRKSSKRELLASCKVGELNRTQMLRSLGDCDAADMRKLETLHAELEYLIELTG